MADFEKIPLLFRDASGIMLEASDVLFNLRFQSFGAVVVGHVRTGIAVLGNRIVFNVVENFIRESRPFRTAFRFRFHLELLVHFYEGDRGCTVERITNRLPLGKPVASTLVIYVLHLG